ncbi:MAG: tetratricopeptide repeat protein, partial [Bacteroidales bacterium]
VNFSMVSNLLFNVGTFMNERFVFSASAGFTLAMGWLFAKWGEQSPKWAIYVLIIILGLYGVKTVTRSFAWKDNLTLFTTDAKTSRNSAKVQVSAAEVLIKEAEKTNNPVKKEKLLLEALQYLKRGGEIYPEYYGVYDLGGKAQFYLKNYDLSLENYLICAKLNPKIPTPYNNIYAVGVNAFNDSVYDVAHRAFSFLTNKYPDSTKYLFQLALVYKSTYKIDSAIIILNKIIKKDSCNADAYNQLGEIYARFLGNNRKAEEYLLKAVQCDPTHSSALENLGVFYGMQGRSKDALNYFKKAHKYNPNSKNLIQNIGLAYKNLGMMDSAQYYLQKAM